MKKILINWIRVGILEALESGKENIRLRIALMMLKEEYMNDIKPGWQTTEFWGTHMTQIITIATTVLAVFKLQLTPEQQTAIIAMGTGIVGLVQAFYTKGRSDIKAVQIQGGNLK